MFKTYTTLHRYNLKSAATGSCCFMISSMIILKYWSLLPHLMFKSNFEVFKYPSLGRAYYPEAVDASCSRIVYFCSGRCLEKRHV